MGPHVWAARVVLQPAAVLVAIQLLLAVPAACRLDLEHEKSYTSVADSDTFVEPPARPARAPLASAGALKLDPILGSRMVLPANDAQLWGIASPHAVLTTTVTSGGASKSLQFHGAADASGSWRMNVSVPAAGLKLYNVTVESSAVHSLSAGGTDASTASSIVSTTLVDVLFGAVIICAGQSNMAVTLDDFGNYTNQPEMNVTMIYQEAQAYEQQIRLFTVLVSGTPPIKSASPYNWGIPSQETLGGSGATAATGGVAPRQNYFSAECWGTGIALARANPDLALGLIVAARGGAAIQSFMSKAAVAECPHVSIVNPPHFGGVSAWWTGMVEPLRYINPSGFIWHQGEENSGQPNDYECFQRAMIADWRKHYGGDIPFVFVQLQPCGIPPDMRFAQAQAVTAHSGLPAVGMASCYDLGDPDPLNAMGLCHSRYKIECGRRLALSLMALLPPSLGKHIHNRETNTDEIIQSHSQSPSVTNVSLIQNGAVVELTISNGRGLHWNGTKQCTRCCGFAGWKRDGVGLTSGHLMEMELDTWQVITPGAVSFPDENATAGITRRIHVLVPSPMTPHGTPYCPAKQLRYAWEDFPECALYNDDGLPLPPFNVSLVSAPNAKA